MVTTTGAEAHPPAPPFDEIAIVGLGLIGGSIALAARQRWPSLRITGIDRQEVLVRAVACGAVSRAATDLDGVAGADLIVLATPVQSIVTCIGQLPGRIAPAAIVTDVGSTKRAVLRAASRLPAAITFIGGHPLAGAATSGLESATPGLFAGRTWLLTPQPACAAHALARLRGLIAGLGAQPAFIEADEHDRLMAALSHLPQLASSALMRVTGELAGAGSLGLASAGLRDTTRLASSPADVWADICATNADHLQAALDRYIAALSALRTALSDRQAIGEAFDLAGQWRQDLETAMLGPEKATR